ncbi:aldo/keto reductase [Flavobacteriaceae bacterium F08102]|nr:aldo/keto reductase [Flavobacteriaceae bacterium F08102]
MRNYMPLGLGLAAIGRPDYINIRNQTKIDKSQKAFETNAFAMLDEAYTLGIRFFDTAPSYGMGEKYLLKWHTQRAHKDVHLSTKWGYTYMANWKIGYRGKHEIKEHSLAKLQEQWSHSKALLPALALYQIHSATFDSKVLNNTAVLEELYRLKKEHVINLGITSSGIHQAALLKTASEIHLYHEPLFDSFQVTYNLFEQSTHNVLRQLLKAGKQVIIKEAMANGRVFPNQQFPNYQKTYQILTKLAHKYHVGMDAIALRFVLDYVKPSLVLSGASNLQQLRENSKVNSFTLNQSELNTLSSLNKNSAHYWSERNALQWN